MDWNEIKSLFDTLCGDPLLNTSYPLHVDDWLPFRSHGNLSFAGEDTLAFYLHIPFCHRLCAFCEYCRMPLPDENTQMRYLQTLERDIQRFCEGHSSVMLYGFDIGGGTPTSLSEESFARLIQIYRDTVASTRQTLDFEPSIEATFATLSERKIGHIVQAGISRISLGIQSTDEAVLRGSHRRACSLERMLEWIEKMHRAGIRKINVDMMYGLQGQTSDTLRQDLEVLRVLDMEQVTLYEFRPNMTRYKSDADKDTKFRFYNILYQGLLSMGYHAHYGQNTFSKDPQDMGVSSYLRHRMLEGASYKGFGLSAQSMSQEGLSYNVGKLADSPSTSLRLTSYAEAYTYRLPAHELFAKFVAISAYSGSLSLKSAGKILHADSEELLKPIIAFCTEVGLITKDGNTLHITPKGFHDYGSVFTLIYRFVQTELKKYANSHPE